MNILTDLEQGTPEWHDTRRCRISGTKLKHVMGTAYARVSLIAELIAGEATGETEPSVTVPAMQRGNEQEEYAIKAFEELMGKKVDTVGACISDQHDWLMLSPDGLIKDENGIYTEAIEVKCPNSKTAIFYKIANFIDEKEHKLTKSKRNICGIPPEYIWQAVQYFIVNPDLKTLYFAVYDDRFTNKNDQLSITSVHRDQLDDHIAKAENELAEFRSDWIKWRGMILSNEV